MSDTPKSETTPEEDVLSEEMDAAFWGAYQAAPQGEGVMGAADFGCRAVVLVARGMKAPEAVAKAIGEVGNYGVPRKYALVPREASPAMTRAAWDDGGLPTDYGIDHAEVLAAKVWAAMIDECEGAL